MDGTRHLKLCGLAALGLALGLGTAEKIEQPPGLATGRAQMRIGDPDGAKT